MNKFANKVNNYIVIANLSVLTISKCVKNFIFKIDSLMPNPTFCQSLLPFGTHF